MSLFEAMADHLAAEYAASAVRDPLTDATKYQASCPVCSLYDRDLERHVAGTLTVYPELQHLECGGCRITLEEAARAFELQTPLGRWAEQLRPLDMAAALAEPPRPEAYRVGHLAQDGALTIVCGAAGSGKSFLAIAACAAVQAGREFAGIHTTQGAAVYVDGEMGRRQMVERFRLIGLPHDAFTVMDAGGLALHLPDAVNALEEALRALGARFVVLDSLRRLAPGAKENESDDMAPLVGRLARMARNLDAAVLLLHHSGHGDGHVARGSTAIVDQADAVFGYMVDRQDGVRRLTCSPRHGGKFRMGREPGDRLFRAVPGEVEGVVVVAVDKENATTTTPKKTKAEEYAERIPGLVAAGHTTRADLAMALSVSRGNQSLRDALARLVDAQQLQWDPAGVYSLLGGGGDDLREAGAATTPTMAELFAAIDGGAA